MNNTSIPIDKANLKQLFSKNFFIVILISIPSAIIAEYLRIPLAWMLGPMLAISIAALMGVKVIMPKLALSLILIILGLHIGNYIDQNLLSQMKDWIWTSMIMFFYILVSILIVSKYLIIITLFPFFVVNFSPTEAMEIEKFNYMDQNHLNLLILLIGSVILIYIFDKIKVPAPLLAGALVASGILQITEIASYKLPDQSINFCLLILGASVGCRFADKSLNEVIKNTVHSFVATALLVVLGIIAAIAASYFVENSFLTLLLSYCPGGIYEVAVIAIAFDLNPNFVAFHHIIRLLMILFTIPVILKLIDRKRSSNP